MVVSNKQKAVFLDRDGVLNVAFVENGKPIPPRRVEELKIYPKAKEVLDIFKSRGYLNIVITNQPDIEKGLMSKKDLDDINGKICSTLAIDKIYVCYCIESPKCNCYKPKIGSFEIASKEFNIDPTASYMIGDRWRDVGAGNRFGCTSIFIDRGYDEDLLESANFTIKQLAEAVEIVI